MAGAWSNSATDLIVLVEEVAGYSGFFAYSPAPGTGKLVMSLAAAAGTDPYGNAYVAGFGIYTAGTNIDVIDSSTGNARFGASASAHLSIDAVNGLLQLANSSGQTTIIEDAGRQAIFCYSGVPALGNLIQSIANTAGTDAVGNAYPSGFTTYDRANNLFVNTHASAISLGQLISGAADTADAAHLVGSGGLLTLASCVDANLPDAAQILVFSGTNNSNTGTTNPAVEFLDTAGTSDVDIYLSGSVIKSDKSGNPYRWQSPSYAANWSNSTTWGSFGGGGNLLFRKTENDRTWIQGVAKAATGAGTTIFTLPSGYFHPSQTTWGTALRNSGGTVTTVAIAVSTSGAVITSTAPANGDQFLLNFEIPLGNVP